MTRSITLVIPHMAAYAFYDTYEKLTLDPLSVLRADIRAIQQQLIKSSEKLNANLLSETQIAVLDGLFMPFIVLPDAYNPDSPTLQAVPEELRKRYVPHSDHDAAYDPGRALQNQIRLIHLKRERKLDLEEEEQEILARYEKRDIEGLRRDLRLHSRINKAVDALQWKRIVDARPDAVYFLLGYKKTFGYFDLLVGETPNPDVWDGADVRFVKVNLGGSRQIESFMRDGVAYQGSLNALGREMRNYMRNRNEARA